MSAPVFKLHSQNMSSFELQVTEILHQIDNLDASMQMMSTAISQTEPGSYTERIFGLDGRSFYVPKINE